MKTIGFLGAATTFLCFCLTQSVCLAEVVLDTDFSKGDFATLGWKAQGDWDQFVYDAPNDPGQLARFKAKQPEGALSKSFAEVAKPQKLDLSLDAGWGWGKAAAGDAISFMLLDASGNGYVFETHRTTQKWGVQWAKVVNRVVPKDKTWATEAIDATHAAIRDGGGLIHLTVSRDANGAWTFASKQWNNGQGGKLTFTDTTTASFTELVLIGSKNFNELAFNKIVLDVTK